MDNLNTNDNTYNNLQHNILIYSIYYADKNDKIDSTVVH